jgi:adenylate cyclase
MGVIRRMLTGLRYVLITWFCGQLVLASSYAASSDTLLQKAIGHQGADTTKIRLLNEVLRARMIAARYDTVYFDLASQSIDLASKIDDLKGKAMALNFRGIGFLMTGGYKDAANAFTAAASINKQLGERLALGKNMKNLASAYNYLGSYPEALESAFKASELFEEIGEADFANRCLLDVQSAFIQVSDYPKAIIYARKSLDFNERKGDENAVASDLYSVGNVYFLMGEFDEALEHLSKALQLMQKLDNSNIPNCLNTMGSVYSSLGNGDSALYCFKQAMIGYERFANPFGRAACLLNLGVEQSNLKRWVEAHRSISEALGYFEKAGALDVVGTCKGKLAKVYLQCGDEHLRQMGIRPSERNGAVLELLNSYVELAKTHGGLDKQSEAWLYLSEAYQEMGKSADALLAFKQHKVFNDSIFNDSNRRAITRSEMQFAFDRKEAQMLAEQEKKDILAAEEIKRKNQQRNAFIGGFALMLGLAGVSYRSYRQKKHDNIIISKEKERSEELLLNILPHEVAEELKEKGHADARLIDHATVLFTDFKGFTAMSEQMSPQELVHDLNICFSEFDRICGRYGIEKIKTIGDAYMAAGGLPTPNGTHATDVVKAALEMRDFVAAGKARKLEAGQPYFEIRIGVHTGPVVAGIVGIKKFQYDIWGDTVNTASRMESSGAVGQVNISQSTYELVKDHFTCLYRGEVEAKGKGRLGMYFVEGNRA